MKTMNATFSQMVSQVPPEIKQEIDFEVEISNRIDNLMNFVSIIFVFLWILLHCKYKLFLW